VRYQEVLEKTLRLGVHAGGLLLCLESGSGVQWQRKCAGTSQVGEDEQVLADAAHRPAFHPRTLRAFCPRSVLRLNPAQSTGFILGFALAPYGQFRCRSGACLAGQKADPSHQMIGVHLVLHTLHTMLISCKRCKSVNTAWMADINLSISRCHGFL
jgi:hypothetical protein